MIKQEEKIKKMFQNKNCSILPYFVEQSIEDTLKNLVIYSIHTVASNNDKAPLEKSIRLLESLKIHSLIKPEQDTMSLLESIYKNYRAKYKKSRHREPILKFISKKDILKIPEDKLIIPSKKQKIKREEAEFILKSISHKILQNWYNNSKDYYILSSNWFMSEGVKEKYKKETKRKINLHKFYRITELLFEYKLIIKKTRWDMKTNRAKPTMFKLGDENFYKRRIVH